MPYCEECGLKKNPDGMCPNYDYEKEKCYPSGAEAHVCNNHAAGEITVTWNQGPGCPLCAAYDTEAELRAEIDRLKEEMRSFAKSEG